WVTDSNEVMRRLGGHTATRVDPSVRLPASGWRLLGDRRGQVWVAAFGGGLMRLSSSTGGAPSIERFAYEQRLSGSPRSLFEDRDGNIWVGMRGGLLRLSEAAIDGSVWVATGHSLNRFDQGRRTVYNVSQTTALHTDTHGQMWVATNQGVGRLQNGRLILEPITPPVQQSRVLALTTDSRGVLWLCSALKGVMAWDGHTLSLFEQRADVFNRNCLSIFTDSRDRVWVGFQGGGVAIIDRDAFQVLGEKDGLAPGLVLGIIEDKSGAVWIESAGGVSRYQNGRITSITQANAPLVDLVPVFVEDEEGYIWVGVNTGMGVIRFH